MKAPTMPTTMLADQAEAEARNDEAGQPARNRADDEENENAFNAHTMLP